MKLSLLPNAYSVCRLASSEPQPDWALRGGFFSVTRTSDELSIVCEESQVPADVQAERGWRCFKLHGPIPFATTGVIVALTRPLAEAGIGVFVVSTYDTDYLMVKQEKLDAAIAALRSAGIEVAAEPHS